MSWLELDGAVNARDLGGLPLADGGRTASGVLLRSDNLQALSARDVDALLSRGLSRVVDLRTEPEVRLEGPGPLIGRVEHVHHSLHPEGGRRTDAAADVVPWKESGESPLVYFYLRYLEDRPDSVLGALEAIASADGAALVHCAAGKDRTGVISALALSAAGVAREAIVADYALTAERNSAILARLRASPTYAADLEGSPDDVHLARPEYMARVLELVDERHGGPVTWLRERGFDPAPLRERLRGQSP